jgi:hypothetical protein
MGIFLRFLKVILKLYKLIHQGKMELTVYYDNETGVVVTGQKEK